MMTKVLTILRAAVLAGAMMMVGACGSGSGSGENTPAMQSTSIDALGTLNAPVTLSAATGSINFTDDASFANNVIIQGFGADDKITVTGANSAQYDAAISSTSAGDVIIAYNSGTALNRIVLQGVIPAGFTGLVFDVASFNALAVGDIEFK